MLRQMLDHRFTKANASEYLDGQLSPAGRERVEHHTSVCPKCHAMMAALRRMIGTLSTAGDPPRAGVADGVLERLRVEG